MLRVQTQELIELRATIRKAAPWREMEMADKLTGTNELGRFIEIPKTTKLHSIDATRT
ncbi:MAG: hypothetical protein G3M78_02640 [Candidatus Nitrohelix vancouverensis]|uniref:Uncharacterized protein n=1 Tax=Candidatus Nitrohelix vancouverensis TaxID=2705534 RepID=A0A7T0G2H7_9BACT|nr:MAG: hypothetical protein G3M78_02640 [Candidatus Nitrohelix vancouverensis]